MFISTAAVVFLAKKSTIDTICCKKIKKNELKLIKVELKLSRNGEKSSFLAGIRYFVKAHYFFINFV